MTEIQGDFVRVTEQRTDEIRNAFRGNTPLPAVFTIPSQYYQDPKSLFLYMYKNAFFQPILTATNNKIRLKAPETDLVTMEELIQYMCIDHLASPAFLKSAHVGFKEWYGKIQDHAKIICNKKLNITLNRDRFFVIAKYISCGINVSMVDRKIQQGSRLVTKVKNGQPVKIHDLNEKLDGIIDNLNKCWIKFKNPGDSRSLCLDESFRKTYSNRDQLKTYLPSKPDKYGQKFQAIVDEDIYLHRLAFDHSKQFANWSGTSGLIDYMMPESYKYKGCTLIADNFYSTEKSLKLLHSQGTAFVGTMRKKSAGKTMNNHGLVKSLTKKMRKNEFRRKFELYEKRLNPDIYGPEQYLQLGFFHDKRDKCVIMCTNDARLCNTREQGHVSKILGPGEKPEIVHFYNKNKCFVDELDRMLSAYTCVRSFKNGNPIRRFISNLWDFAFHNCFVLFRKYHMLPLNRDSKYAKMDRVGRLRSEFYWDCLFGMIGYQAEVPPLPINLHSLPHCGPFPVSKTCEIALPVHTQRSRTAYKCGVCQKYICKRDQILLCPICYKDNVHG